MARVRGGGFTLVAVRVITFGLTGLAFIVFARELHPEQYGEYAAAQSIVTVLLVLQFMGVDQLYLQRRIDDHGLEVGATQVTVIVATLMVLAAALWPGLSSAERWCVLLLGAISALEMLKNPWLLRPALALDFATRAVREGITRSSRIVILMGVAFFVHRAATLAALGLVLAILMLVPTPGRFVFSRSLVSKEALATLRAGLPFAISGLLFTIYFTADASLLASLRPAIEVGYYRAAYNIIQAAVVLPIALNMDIMRPRLYALRRAGQRRRRVLRQFGIISIGLGLAVGAGIALISHPLVGLLYGPAYAPAAPLLTLLALALPFHYATSWLTNGLIAFDAVRPVLIVQLTLAILNVAGNLILIPRQGAHGAAAMTLATESTGTVITAALVYIVRQRA